jgi:hypothetical protein
MSSQVDEKSSQVDNSECEEILLSDFEEPEPTFETLQTHFHLVTYITKNVAIKCGRYIEYTFSSQMEILESMSDEERQTFIQLFSSSAMKQDLTTIYVCFTIFEKDDVVLVVKMSHSNTIRSVYFLRNGEETYYIQVHRPAEIVEHIMFILM